MTEPNPYAAPESGAMSPSGRENALGHHDQADLFVQSLPPVMLKAAVFVLGFMSLFMLVFAIRLAISVEQDALAIGLEIAHLVVGVAGFVIARGLLRGSTTAFVASLVVCPLSALASLFALLTGSPGGLFNGGFSVAAVILVALNWPTIKRIGVARAALKAAGVDHV